MKHTSPLRMRYNELNGTGKQHVRKLLAISSFETGELSRPRIYQMLDYSPAQWREKLSGKSQSYWQDKLQRVANYLKCPVEDLYQISITKKVA